MIWRGFYAMWVYAFTERRVRVIRWYVALPLPMLAVPTVGLFVVLLFTGEAEPSMLWAPLFLPLSIAAPLALYRIERKRADPPGSQGRWK